MDNKILTVDDYIAQFPAETQVLLSIVRQTVRSAAPEAKEVIKYGIPTFKMKSNLVHFAGYKNHIGFYPGPVALSHFKEEIKLFKSSKGAVQFKLDKDLPLDLIRKITLFCVEEQR